MSKNHVFLVSVVFLLGLSVIAGAAPKRRLVPALPPLTAPVDPAAPADPTPPPAPAATNAAPGETSLYDGQAPDQSGLTTAPWGGGDVQDDTATTLDNGHSLLITTVDDYQGAKITFNTPVPLGGLKPTRFLEMTLHFPTVIAPPPASTDPNAPAPVPVPPPPPAPSRGRHRHGHPADNAAGPDTSTAPVITSLCWVLTLADGRQTEVRRPLPEGAVNGRDWFRLAVPLSALRFPAGGDSPLQSVTITGDGFSYLSLGAIKIVSDDTPITASAGRIQTVGRGTEVIFHATGDGGASVLRYAWNFGTADPDTTTPASRTVEQVEGQTVQTQFFSAGDYTVTLTVSDVDGVKAPATSTVTVHVQ